MKKIFILMITVAAASALMVVAKEKEKATTKTAPAAQASEHKIVTANDIQWSDAPPSLPAGAKMAVLDGDPGKAGSFTIRLKMPAGYKIPAHTHPTVERVTGISGTGRLGMGEKLDESAAKDVGPGTFAVLPANMAHFAYSNEECVVQIQSEGPFAIKYINPSDDPRNAAKK
jgi:quercetin dioxygenase-like cupin family protein